jgi:hypothetical protein
MVDAERSNAVLQSDMPIYSTYSQPLTPDVIVISVSPSRR